MEYIGRIGMDASKHCFQLHGMNAAEKVVLRKKLRRKEMVAFFKALASTVIGIEACGTSHHWKQLYCNRAEPMPELARQRADGGIDPTRATLRAFYWPPKVPWVFGTRIAETISASVHLRARQQARHMSASDLIRALPTTLRGGGRLHMKAFGVGRPTAKNENVPPTRNQRAPQWLQSLNKEEFMKKTLLIPGFFCVAAITFAFPADAKPGGCIKGAIVGGIAGHFAGHGGIGAAAGCTYGIHRRKVYDHENEGRSNYERRGIGNSGS